MSFFGALFPALSLAFQFGWTGIMLGVPFGVAAASDAEKSSRRERRILI